MLPLREAMSELRGKEKERRIKHLFPSSSRDNYRKAFNPKSYKSILWEETESRFSGAL